MARRKHILKPEAWESLPEAELLQLRVRDLGLCIADSPLQGRVAQLYAELGARGLAFRPPCYLADEWFCPDKEPVIGIPFVLAHPRLTQLEHKLMLEVEGGDALACLQLLRHECGHAINYAYRLYRRTRWRELFGPFSARYSDMYDSRPYSKRYVVHLRDNYAQSHPDEDFAETFAVWLTPGSNWRERYREWPAMRKLQYVDRVMRTLAGREPEVTAGATPWSAARMTSTLGAYYERKRRYLGDDFPGYYDAHLCRLFARSGTAAARTRASRFLRRHRRQIVDGVATWTGQRKYDIQQLINKLIARCDVMDLYANESDEAMIVKVTAFVTAVGNKVLSFKPERDHA
ncbi:MAG: putative zinc-binding metallopeptidase [Lentisphaerae bacterium]|nr:putative zinc-binding metallopeptidase [Lentisphaerota bacterium]